MALQLHGKYILITGATDGVVRAAALEAARQGAIVIAHGRSPEKGAQLIADLEGPHTADARHYLADFVRLDDVRRLAPSYGRRSPISMLSLAMLVSCHAIVVRRVATGMS
jgi:NAD(P)-dependent dehydrogenase (short-subunit alcohol dehydrogenase family)